MRFSDQSVIGPLPIADGKTPQTVMLLGALLLAAPRAPGLFLLCGHPHYQKPFAYRMDGSLRSAPCTANLTHIGSILSTFHGDREFRLVAPSLPACRQATIKVTARPLAGVERE